MLLIFFCAGSFSTFVGFLSTCAGLLYHLSGQPSFMYAGSLLGPSPLGWGWGIKITKVGCMGRVKNLIVLKSQNIVVITSHT